MKKNNYFRLLFYIMCCACVRSCFRRVQLFATLWSVLRQVPLSMGILQARILSGLPCPSPGDLPDSRTEPKFLTFPALAGGFFATSATWKTSSYIIHNDFLKIRAVPREITDEVLMNIILVKGIREEQ